MGSINVIKPLLSTAQSSSAAATSTFFLHWKPEIWIPSSQLIIFLTSVVFRDSNPWQVTVDYRQLRNSRGRFWFDFKKAKKWANRVQRNFTIIFMIWRRQRPTRALPSLKWMIAGLRTKELNLSDWCWDFGSNNNRPLWSKAFRLHLKPFET